MSTPIDSLNRSTPEVVHYLHQVQQVGVEQSVKAWNQLACIICEPVMALESIAMKKSHLDHSAEVGTAVQLLEMLKDGILPYNHGKGSFGSFAYYFLTGDAKDIARKQRNRARLLKKRKPLNPGSGQTLRAYQSAMICLEKMLLSLSVDDRAICKSLWMDPANPAGGAIAKKIHRSPSFVSGRKRKLQNQAIELVRIAVAI